LALDMAKYQKLFLEEATEHLSEISHALLELEKDTSGAEPIDTIFRMAHSIKSMAASLGYDAVAELAHALEDRMETIRSAGRVSSQGELSLLFRGLEGLERMVGAVRDTGEPPSPDASLLAALAQPPAADSPAGPERAPAQTAPDVGPEGMVPPSVAGAGAVDPKKKHPS
jgi:two-component system chemotaxis sensor kinase CheA